MEEWVSQREFARRRGVTHRAVQKAIAAGRVTAVRRDANGRITAIELHAASAQWAENTDPAQAERSGTQMQPAAADALDVGASTAGRASSEGAPGQLDFAAESTPQVASAETPAPPNKDPHGYLESRAKTEKFKSAQAELEYLKAIGHLVSRADEATVKSRRYRAMRDKLLGIADREASVLAAERDPIQVHAILTKAIKQVLHELSDDAGAEIARGAAERVAA